MLVQDGGMIEASNRFAAAEQHRVNKGVIEADERKANFSALQQ